MLSEEKLQEKWESLTFTDNFIFSHVMHDENICRQVVELILGVRIGKIHYLSAQDEHKTDPDSMRIIMDVFLRDENRIITVEMQMGHKTELPNYQSVADVSTTKLFLNTATEQLRDLDQELRLFYDYVRGSPAQTSFTKELDVAISRMKQEKEERNMYLTYTSRMMEFRRDGLEEGISIGLTQG